MGNYSEIKRIDINLLKEHPANAVFFNQPTKKEIEELYQSLKNVGMIEPVIINKNYEILSGHNRWRVLKDMIKAKEIDIRIFDGTQEEEIEILVDANIVRRELDKDCLIRIEKNKYKFLDKKKIIETLSPKIKNIVFSYKDRISKDFLCKIAQMSQEEQVLIVNELMVIFEMERKRIEKNEKELFSNKAITEKQFNKIVEIKEEFNEKEKELHEKIKKLEIIIAEKDDLINIHKKKIKQKELDLIKQEEERLKILDRYENLKQKYLNQEIPDNVKKEIENLRQEVNNKEKKIDEIRKEIADWQCEYEIMESKYKELLEKKDEIVRIEAKKIQESYEIKFKEIEKDREYYKNKYEEEKRKKEKLEEILNNNEQDLDPFEKNKIDKFIGVLSIVNDELSFVITILSKISNPVILKKYSTFYKEIVLKMLSEYIKFANFADTRINGDLVHLKNEILMMLKNIESIDK